jgi:hypothetical protein
MIRRFASVALVAIAAFSVPAVALAQEEPTKSLIVFTQSGPNQGLPGERANAVGSFEPPPCPQGEGLPPNVGRVYIFFDGRRVAEAAGHPDPPGFSGGIFEVPKNAKPGPDHTVSASCDPSGEPVRVDGPFTVLGAGQEPVEPPPEEVVPSDRSSFAASITDVRDAFNDRPQILKNLLLALILLLLVFPSQLFNATLEEHYDEVRGWFGLGRRDKGEKKVPAKALRWLAFLLFAVVGSAIYGFLDPLFGPSRMNMSLILLGGIFASILITTLAFVVIPGLLFKAGRQAGGYIKVLPGTLLVAAVCVAVSRLVHFLPGYFYGVIAAFAITRGLSRRQTGLNTLIAAVITLAVSVGAWLTWIPIKESALEPGASSLMLVLDAALAATFVAGLEALAFGLIPMRFLPGERIFSWSKIAWGIIFLIGAAGFVHIIVRSNASAAPQPNSLYTTVALFLGFGLFSVLFWGFFRFRKVKPAAPVAPAPPTEGAQPAEPPPLPKPPAGKPKTKPKPKAKPAGSKKSPAKKAKRKAASKPKTGKSKS